MKQFSCGDVVPGCKAVMTGETGDEVLAQVAEHAKRDQGMEQVPAELVPQVQSKIRNVPTA